jgi:hypothetical protein
LSESLSGTFPWKQLEKTVISPANAAFIIVGEAFMAYGTVWYDDFSVQKADH